MRTDGLRFCQEYRLRKKNVDVLWNARVRGAGSPVEQGPRFLHRSMVTWNLHFRTTDWQVGICSTSLLALIVIMRTAIGRDLCIATRTRRPRDELFLSSINAKLNVLGGLFVNSLATMHEITWCCLVIDVSSHCCSNGHSLHNSSIPLVAYGLPCYHAFPFGYYF
jgi:hypothetical protein